MSRIRADFDVSGAFVLPENSEPVVLRPSLDIEIILRNAAADPTGHVPGLLASVITTGTLETAPDIFRELLVKQLDALSFVTRSAFAVEQCRRVMEWEPYQKTRAIRYLRKFDPLHPPNPSLTAESVASAEAILRAPLPVFVRQAMGYFRYGVLATQIEDQFQQFWLAIETLAVGRKERATVPILCPTCRGPLTCDACQKQPQRRPMAAEAIREMISLYFQPDPAGIYRKLVGVRNHLTHGGAPASVEGKFGAFDALVNLAGFVAWQSLMASLPTPEKPYYITPGENEGFANKMLIVGPNGSFDFDGDGEHPPEDRIPNVEIALNVRFGPLEGGQS
jgi:hypothetical protein